MLRFTFLLQSLLLFLPRLEGDKNQAATGWPQRAEWRIGFGMLPQSATSQGAKTNLTSPFHFTVCSRKTQYSTTTVAEPTRHAHRRTSVHHLQSAHWNWQTACVGCLDPPPPPAPWHRGILFISDRKRPLRQSLKTTGLLSKLFAGSHQSIHSRPTQLVWLERDSRMGAAACGDPRQHKPSVTYLRQRTTDLTGWRKTPN